MRVSTDPCDPGYVNWAMDRRARALLNGAVVDDVVMADEEKGVIEVLARDAAGKIMFANDRVLRRVLCGKVEVLRGAEAEAQP